MSSKTYIIAWDGALENCLDINRQLKDSGLDYVFYNVSAYETDDTHWIRSEDVRYYGHFFNAVTDFLQTNHEVLVFNAGDPAYESYSDYTKKIERLFESDSEIYVFAPSFDNDSFSNEGSIIQESEMHDGLYLATHTNGIMVAIRKELVQTMYDFYLWSNGANMVDFTKIYSGWGLDTIYNSFAIYLNKKIYRDHVTMHHPKSSPYNTHAAYKEMESVVEASRHFAKSIGMNPYTLIRIQETMISKMINRLPTPVSYIYFNLEKELKI